MTAAGFSIFGEIFENFDEFSKFSNASSSKFYKKSVKSVLNKKCLELSVDAEYTFKIFKKNFFLAELWIFVTGPRFRAFTPRYLGPRSQRVNDLGGKYFFAQILFL